MKTSTLLMTLLLVNSGILITQIIPQFIISLNPFIFGGAEITFGVLYYIHKILKSVRAVFDVDVRL